MLLGYGAKFSSLFDRSGDAAALLQEWKVLWSEVMTGLSMGQIQHGMSKVLTEFPEFPPAVGQFRALCEAAPRPPAKLLSEPVIPLAGAGYVAMRVKAAALGLISEFNLERNAANKKHGGEEHF